MKYRELQTLQGAIEYVEDGGEIKISGYRGRDIEIVIPDTIDDLPVTALLKKAFLSVKSVRKVVLPYTVTDLGDFAFAFCSNLQSVTLSEKVEEIGAVVFKECAALKEIHVISENADDIPQKKEMDYAHLLAATVGILEAPFLFRPGQIYDIDWIRQWDVRMMNIMQVDDMEGYSKLLLCGEEDYGSDENHPDVYKSSRIKGKIRLAMLRMMHDYGLTEERKDFLCKYLMQYKKGQETEETWQVVLNEHGDEKEYYDLLMELALVDHQNLQGMLKDMGDQHAEMKAYLLNFDEGSTSNDFFDGLDL